MAQIGISLRMCDDVYELFIAQVNKSSGDADSMATKFDISLYSWNR